MSIETDSTTFAFLSSGTDPEHAVTDTMQHCPTIDGTGIFNWTARISAYDSDDNDISFSDITGTYTVVKSQPTLKISVSNTAPRVGQTVRLRLCASLGKSAVRYLTFTLSSTSKGRTSRGTYFTDGTGCYTGTAKSTTAAVSYSAVSAPTDVLSAGKSAIIIVRGRK